MSEAWDKALAAAIGLACLFLIVRCAHAEPAGAPPASRQYQRTLTREARVLWGLDAPVAVFAAQIQAESAWNPGICSKFACGLAQFTPTTAQWISGAYPSQLGEDQPFNPQWAIRALVTYDHYLYTPIRGASTDCDRLAFALSEYNGGPEWLQRDIEMCAGKDGCDATRWFGGVAEVNAGRGLPFWKENRGYPTRILILYQHLYATWGGVVTCLVSGSSV